MRVWQEDMLTTLLNVDTLEPGEILARMEVAARSLGFEYCTYGIRVPFPATNPQVAILSNYPSAWLRRYQEQRYYLIDPTVRHAQRSQAPIIWSDDVFADAAHLWDEVRSHGVNVGWAQSNIDGYGGVFGMLVLARSKDCIRPAELEANELKMRWLVNLSHVALSHRLMPRIARRPSSPLTGREVEILRWTADGKTASEISQILNVSEHTVTFHMGNAIRKLGSSNKTAAVVKASLLGLL